MCPASFCYLGSQHSGDRDRTVSVFVVSHYGNVRSDCDFEHNG